MGKYVMFVQSQAKPGQDDDYNAWYDNDHLREICAVPGVTSGRRLTLTPVVMGGSPLRYASIYEFEADSAEAFMGDMAQRAAGMTQSDALDRETTTLWVYEVNKPAE